MLSGLHPLETGARINLADPELVRRDTMLTWQLRDFGYRTILATDERRFSNLDESYGFDTVIGPAAGAADFILGLAGDFPLVNLVASTRLGSAIFPFLYSNRAVHRLYRPEQFAAQLGANLQEDAREQPIFMVSHFCLPHWPYDWAGAPEYQADKPTDYSAESRRPKKQTHQILERRLLAYESALVKVDEQLETLLTSLREKGLLDNAIVVLLSDHGESVGWPEEVLVDVNDPDMPVAVKRRNGHGTNVFALDQHRIFMAYKRYGTQAFPSGERKQRFFSYDLKSTLLDLLGAPIYEAERSVSMVPWIKDAQLTALDRAVFLETGFTPPAINSLTIDPAEVFSQGHSYYAIGNDARLVIKGDKLDEIVRNKQRGILKGSRLLAQVNASTSSNEQRYDWILANLGLREAVKLEAENLHSECLSPCRAMIRELIDFYGDELGSTEWLTESAIY
jgi:hypothetical protein